MTTEPIHLLLADDDKDDRFLFEDALRELPLSVRLTTVNDGEQLMNLLDDIKPLPHVLFLDLNMPRKNGMECLSEIKNSHKLRPLLVIMFSTTSERLIINTLYQKGALYYIRKPAEFSKLKKAIHKALITISKEKRIQPSREQFVLTGE